MKSINSKSESQKTEAKASIKRKNYYSAQEYINLAEDYKKVKESVLKIESKQRLMLLINSL